MKDFEELVLRMEMHSMTLPRPCLQLNLQDAKMVLEYALKFFLNMQTKSLVWLAEYDEVADWLRDNKGQGLYLYGNCGRGKSLMTRYVLPAILLGYFGKVVNVYDMQVMNANLDEALTKSVLALDDIGTEEVVNIYGNKRFAFAELMDRAEKESNLLIISSNLQEKELQKRYGDRVCDRLRGCTKRVLFEGNSLRG